MRTVDLEKFAAEKQRILEAARACFAEHGFHRASTDMICTRGEISPGKLFHYFPNKKSLILAVVEEQNTHTGEWVEALAAQKNPVGAIVEFVENVLYLSADSVQCRLIIGIAAEASRDDEVAELSRKGDHFLARGLRTLVVRAQRLGLDMSGLSTDQVVKVLMVFVDGIFSRVASDPSFDPYSERDTFRMVVLSLLGSTEGTGDE